MIRFFTFSTLILILFMSSLVFSQVVPAEQDTIVVDGGNTNIGLLETTINSDTTSGGNRINPSRVYKLKANTVYVQESPILFGGTKDSTSTLIIVGEKGGNMPIILMAPKDGGDAFSNQVHGSLTISNIYWPVKTVTGKAEVFFYMYRDNQTLRLDGLVTEFGWGDMFVLDNVKKGMNVFVKNCYFRDANRFSNSWNTSVISRGINGEPYDTLWVENTTSSNSGMAFFGKLNPVKFLYFNQNTIINIAKYPFFFHQFEEAYFTNNLFINCNWEGECLSTADTQHPDGAGMGVTNLDTIDATLWELGHGYVPAMEDVKWISSNNLHFTSPFLNNYYSGGLNDVADYPLSNRSWSLNVTEDMLPIPVENIPPIFLNAVTEGLIAEYEGIVASENHIQIDPQMNTKGIGSQAIADDMGHFARNNYGVAVEGETYDTTWAFGDLNPQTVPGPGTEDGQGFARISDLIEDFSYQADIRSTINGRPLGALTWWPEELATWDTEAELQKVIEFYDAITDVERDGESLPSEYELVQNYPNPFNPSTTIKYSIPELANVSLTIYNALGQEVMTLVNQEQVAGSYKVTFDASNLSSGIYFYSLKSGNYMQTMKMMLLK